MRKNPDRFYLKNILSHIPEYVFWKDLNSIYLGCNYNFATLAGLNFVDQIIGKTDEELPWSRYAEKIYLKEDKKIIKTKQPITHENVPFIDASGTQRIITISKSPLLDEKDNVIGILGVFHDITELKNTQTALLKQIKETEKAYHSKTEFLSMTTHEIRNPIGNITSFSDILKEDINKIKKIILKDASKGNSKKEIKLKECKKLFDRIMENVEIIEHESYKALDYLKSLGELHQLQKEGVKPYFASIKIQELIERAIRNLSKYNKKNIDIKFSISPSLPKVVEIDYGNIYEALEVIIYNAIRFSHNKNKVKINAAKENNFLKISVENAGEKISKSQINDLCSEEADKEIDSRASLYRKPSLRLTQAKIKIEASGGKLKIERTPNGTRVSIYAVCKNPILSENEKTNHGVSKKLAKNIYQILVVEDDPLFQKNEKNIFEKLGHSVSVASTGNEALKKFSKKHYDIIFLDISLPDMNGVDIIRKIRKDNKDLVIIVVTSHAHQEDIEFFEEVGATLVLIKPVSVQQFKECLEIDLDNED